MRRAFERRERKNLRKVACLFVNTCDKNKNRMNNDFHFITLVLSLPHAVLVVLLKQDAIIYDSAIVNALFILHSLLRHLPPPLTEWPLFTRDDMTNNGIAHVLGLYPPPLCRPDLIYRLELEDDSSPASGSHSLCCMFSYSVWL